VTDFQIFKFTNFQIKMMQSSNIILLFFILAITAIGFAQNKTKDITYKVTFIELGSVKCIPCQQMQPILKSIEKNYGEQVKVIFHDVWTPEGKAYATEYKINLIPTQVFLDENGKEFFRHEGFFPEEEVVKLLKTKGVK